MSMCVALAGPGRCRTDVPASFVSAQLLTWAPPSFTASHNVFAQTQLSVLQHRRLPQVVPAVQAPWQPPAQDRPARPCGPLRPLGGVPLLLGIRETRPSPGSAGDTSVTFLSLLRTVCPPPAPPVCSQQASWAWRTSRASSQVQQKGGAGEEQQPLNEEDHRVAPQKLAQLWPLLRRGFCTHAVPHQEAVHSGGLQGEVTQYCKIFV